MTTITENMQNSAALQFVISQGWDYKVGTAPNIVLAKCPYCSKEFHCYMELHSNDGQTQRDGLHMCQRCGKSNNIYGLKQYLGISIPGVSSQKDWASSEKKIDPLPDINACHESLLADDDAVEYLCNIRGFSLDILKKQKIGLTKHFFKSTGKDTRALVFPYLVNNNPVWVHYRTLPDPNDLKKVPKDFASPRGHEATLFNIDALNQATNEIVLVEGECNTIAALDKGITTICGVPGANIKKAEWLDKIEKLEKVYILYDKDKVGQKAAQELASRVGIEKCFKIVLPDFEVVTESGETRKGKDLNEWFVSGGGTAEEFYKLKDDAVLFGVDGVASTSDALDEFTEELENKGASQKYAWPIIADIVQFDEGDIIDILAEEKVGKLQSVDSKVLMEDGSWRRMGDLEIGDRLASIDGKENLVSAIYPQGIQKLYRCTFSDGRSTLAGGPHLWSVNSVNNWGEFKVFTTEAIKHHHINKQHHNAKLYIPTIEGKFGTESEYLPFDPWMLGCLLGDGSFAVGSTLKLTTTDDEIVRKFQERLPKYGLQINAIGEHRERWKNGHIKASSLTVKQFSITSTDGGKNYLIEVLKNLGLHGCTSDTKFIPQIYLESSNESRVALLQGLMDTDGTAGNRQGTPSYCTVSPILAKDFVYLVRSLGGICKVGKPQKKTFRYKGKLRHGLEAYIIVVRVSDPLMCFTLQRKLSRCKPRENYARLTFDDISFEKEGESQCIFVSHPSHLYITDDFIVTHNTTIALNLVEYMVDTYKEDAIFISTEMTRAKLARKWVCHKSGICDSLPKTADEAAALTAQFKQAIPSVKELAANREGTLYIAYPKYSTMDEIYKLIIDCIRRYGVKWIVVDNIQRLCDLTIGNRNRTQWLSEISKRLSQIAKDYNVQLIRIIQPHKIGEGKMTVSGSVDGSSQINKDCDCLLIANRAKISGVSKDILEKGGYIQSDTTFAPEMLLTCALSRYSAGGEVMVYFNGATSTVHTLTEGKVKAMKSNNPVVGYEAQAESKNLPLNALKDALDSSGGSDEGIKI